MMLRRKHHAEIKDKLEAMMSRRCEGHLQGSLTKERKMCLDVDVTVVRSSYQVVRKFL